MLPIVIVTQEMISEAKRLARTVSVNRTVASKIDTITGILGEFAFAQYLYSDWRKNNVGNNKGNLDFKNIEIKTSAYPLNENLHLLVREDYAKKRKPPYYVQIIIDVASRRAEDIQPNSRAVLCGFATAREVDEAPKKDFGSKIGERGGYQCRYLPVKDLHPIEELCLKLNLS